MHTDPKRTVWLLDELERLGMTDEAFQIVHHMDRETIRRHRNYCETRPETFQPGGSNARVQMRLELIWGAYMGGRFVSKDLAIFRALAEAAIIEIPMGAK